MHFKYAHIKENDKYVVLSLGKTNKNIAITYIILHAVIQHDNTKRENKREPLYGEKTKQKARYCSAFKFIKSSTNQS